MLEHQYFKSVNNIVCKFLLWVVNVRAALVLCCVVVGDKQAWCDVLWGRICGTWRVWWSMVRGGCGVCKCEEGT